MDHLIQPGEDLQRASVPALVVGTIVTLAALFGTGILDRVWPLPAVKVIGQEAADLKKAREEAKLSDGSATAWLGKELASRSRTRDLIGPWWAAALLLYGKSAPANLIVGEDGWLFLRSRAVLPPTRIENGPAFGAHLVYALRRRFAMYGSDLRPVPLARKAALCADRLPSGIDVAPSFDHEVSQALSEAGMPNVDTLALWQELDQEDTFFKLDSHWQLKSEIALARALARLHPDLMGGDEAAWYSEQRKEVAATLLSHAGIPRTHPAWKLMPRGKTTRLRLEPEELWNRLASPSNRSDIALVGTSFTSNYSIHTLLVCLFKRPIERVALRGSPLFGALAQYVRARGSGALAKVVLAEFPTYQIAQSSNGALAIGTLAQELPPLSVYPVPGGELKVTDRPVRHGGRLQRGQFSRGAGISCGFGALGVELRVTGDAPSEWMLSTGGGQTKVRFPAGGGRAVLPFLEGATWKGSGGLYAMGVGAEKAEVSARLVIDDDLRSAQSLTVREHEGDRSVHVSVTGDHPTPLPVHPMQTLVVDWTDRADRLDVVVNGHRKNGDPKSLKWSFSPLRTQTAVLTLGALLDGTIDEVLVVGPRGGARVRTFVPGS